jgi:competence protein ComEC
MIPILVITLAWLTGIFLQGWLDFPVEGLFWGAGLSLVLGLAGLIFARFKFRPVRVLSLPLVGLLCGAACLGGLRLVWSAPSDGPDSVLYYQNQSEIVLTGLVSAEPLYNSRSGSFRFEAQGINLPGSSRPAPVSGDIYVRTGGSFEVKRGDLVQLTGTLAPPKEISGEDFPYRDWLKRQGIYTTLDYPRLKLLATGQDFFLGRWFYQLNEQARQVISQFVPGEEGGLLAGLLLGDKSGLSDRTRQDFTTSGLAHLLAVSGSNISIAIMLTTLALSRFVKRRTVVWLTLGVVLFYVLLVGFSPSVLRAGLMGGLALIGLLLGREYSGLAGLSGSALILTIWQPAILMDVGFQLSFLATLGLLALTPVWQQPVKGWLLFLRDSLVITLAAEAMTLPLVIYYFHQIPLVGVLANLLVLPVIGVIMALGGLTLTAGLLLSGFSIPAQASGGWCWLFLAYVLAVVQFCAGLPFASLQIPVFHPVWIFLYYLVLAGLFWWYQPGKTSQFKQQVLQLAGSGAGVAIAFLLAVGAWAVTIVLL